MEKSGGFHTVTAVGIGVVVAQSALGIGVSLVRWVALPPGPETNKGS